ncbi:MAG: methyltransferase domain-containing protein [Verrucomicrobiota bacterium]|nr:methyltransferase domain-containing protein [Verrucomicrobiota bacterium]
MSFWVPARAFSKHCPEMMDLPGQPEVLLKNDLHFLGAINRHLGGHAVLRNFFQIADLPQPLTILDCATGFGDGPRFLVDMFRSKQRKVSITAVDLRKETLNVAREASLGYPEITFVEGDILNPNSLPDGKFDVVMCNLVLHHFDLDDAVSIIRGITQKSKRYVFVNDLIRSRFYIGAAHVLACLTSNPMSKHDSVLSARRAFSREEFRGILESAGWAGFHPGKSLFGRQFGWCEVAV